MKQVIGLLLSSAMLLACRQELTSANAGGGAPAAYPSGDAVDVYRAAIEEIVYRPTPAANTIVVVDHIMRGGWHRGDESLREIWHRRALETPIDSALLADMIAVNETSVQLRPDFLPNGRVGLISEEQIETLRKRGDSVERAPRIAPRRDYVGFWVVFYNAYPAARGLIRLSRVGFNRSHTKAAIEYNIGCGGLCGLGGFILFKKTSAGWMVTKNVMEWIS